MFRTEHRWLTRFRSSAVHSRKRAARICRCVAQPNARAVSSHDASQTALRSRTTLQSRGLTLVRCPDGTTAAECFYQRHLMMGASPGNLGTWKRERSSKAPYVYVSTIEAIVSPAPLVPCSASPPAACCSAPFAVPGAGTLFGMEYQGNCPVPGVPEPGNLVLLAMGLLPLSALARMKVRRTRSNHAQPT